MCEGCVLSSRATGCRSRGPGDTLPTLSGETLLYGPKSPSDTPGWALASQEGSVVGTPWGTLLKKWVWAALVAEANFRNICTLSTSRACVETP